MRKSQCLRRILLLRHIFLFILFACLLTSCESKKTIVHGLDEKEANEILVFLSTRGIIATKVPAVSEGAGAKVALWDVSVNSSQASEAMALLNQVGLPRRRGMNLLSIFANVGLVPSGMQEKIRYQAGLAEQIASTIRKIDGVLDADVQISFPDEDPLNPNAPKQKITASIYVKHSGVLDDPNLHLITRIKRLVAGSVTGLNYDNVTVIGDRVRYSSFPITGTGLPLGEEEPSYVTVWSMTLAKSSLSRFRIIFFSFIFGILILLVLLIWILRRISPMLAPVGGLKKLFSSQPLQPESIPSPTVAKEEKKEEKKEDKEPGESGTP